MRLPFRFLRTRAAVRRAAGLAILGVAAETAVAATATSTVLSACAGARPTGAPRQDRTVITREQILATHHTSAYDVVEALRSNWLRPHGPDSFNTPGEVIVYLDNSRLGGVEMLRNIVPSNLAYIRFINAVEASSRWGVGHTQGVIYLATQVGP